MISKRRFNCLVLVMISWTPLTKSVLPKHKVEVVDNGYVGVTVAISGKLQENTNYIKQLKDLFTETSAQLYHSTKYHLYFKNVTIVVPKTWSRKQEYGTISGPQLNLAHVILDEQNDIVGNRPYVVGMSACGAEGQYIHITPYSMVKYPNLAKAMVHQWGHLRWGLFDEYPETESPMFGQQKTFYAIGGTYKPNTCSDRIKGRYLKQCNNPNSKCSAINGVPDSDCRFCADDPSDTKSSIMGYYNLKGISQFCDEAKSSVDPTEHHNYKADTLQNRLCGIRSAWEVMRLHPDFIDLAAGNSSMVTAPTFNIVQQGNQKVVIVMDVSGSMKTNKKFEKLLQVSRNYLLNIVDSETEVCLVTFDSDASIIKELAQMSSDTIRQDFVDALPSTAVGGTSIGAGLRKGIQCIIDPGENTRGAIILLISDGHETDAPWIRDVQQEVEDAGVVVMSLAFTDQSDIQMIDLATRTGGRSFLYSGLDTSSVLLDAFWQSTTVTGNMENAHILVQSKALKVSSSSPYRGNFIIDSTIGNDTVIVLSGSGVNYLSITVSSPSSQLYRSEQCSSTSCRLLIPGIAEKGIYNVTVKSNSNSESNIIYSVQSKRRTDNSKAIVTISWTSGGQIDMTKGTLVKLYTSVMRSGVPVLGVTVKAVLDGSSRDLLLFDKGYGADVLENDGIYSAYILPKHLTGNGRTSAKVLIENKDGTATLIAPLRRRKRSTDSIEKIALTTVSTDLFERTTLSEEFTVINYDASNTDDVLAPSKITTLDLVSVDNNARRFGLRFKAVGDDFDDGIARAYEVRISHNFDELISNPNNVLQITDNITTPGDPGTYEYIYVEIPTNFSTYYLGVRAIDEVNNKGEMSNIVSLSIITDTWWQVNTGTILHVNIMNLAVIVFIFLFVIYS